MPIPDNNQPLSTTQKRSGAPNGKVIIKTDQLEGQRKQSGRPDRYASGISPGEEDPGDDGEESEETSLPVGSSIIIKIINLKASPSFLPFCSTFLSVATRSGCLPAFLSLCTLTHASEDSI